MELWDSEGKLRHEAFEEGPGLCAALAELQKGRQEDAAVFYPPGAERPLGDEHACPPGCKRWRGVRDGCLSSFKFKLGGSGSERADELRRDGSLVVKLELSYQPYAERSLERRAPLFLVYFWRKDRLEAPLGFYEASEKLQGHAWKFLPCADQSAARARALEGLSSLLSAVPPSSRSRSPRRQVVDVEAPRRGELAPIRTTHDGYTFDSQLELVHYFALCRMGLAYEPNPGSFFVGDETRVPLPHHTYTPDARAVLRVETSSFRQTTEVLVEIKPTPPTETERCKLYALAKQCGQKVLCLYGCEGWILYPGAVRGSGSYRRPLHEPFQAKLYVPGSRTEDPALIGGLVWRCDKRGYYLGGEPSRPSAEELASIRAVYLKACEDAKRVISQIREAARAAPDEL
jgi:hypothetical protein